MVWDLFDYRLFRIVSFSLECKALIFTGIQIDNDLGSFFLDVRRWKAAQLTLNIHHNFRITLALLQFWFVGNGSILVSLGQGREVGVESFGPQWGGRVGCFCLEVALSF